MFSFTDHIILDIKFMCYHILWMSFGNDIIQNKEWFLESLHSLSYTVENKTLIGIHKLYFS